MNETCSIEGCSKPGRRRGWCSAHHTRYLRHGDPLGGHFQRDKTTEERFWEKVDRSGGANACWWWLGSQGTKGHGHFSLPGSVVVIASRYSYDLAHPAEPLGTRWALHTCDNPPCVNPAHLYAGGYRENAADRRARPKPKKTHCPYGHAYTKANTYALTRPNGIVARKCRRCARERARLK